MTHVAALKVAWFTDRFNGTLLIMTHRRSETAEHKVF